MNPSGSRTEADSVALVVFMNRHGQPRNQNCQCPAQEGPRARETPRRTIHRSTTTRDSTEAAYASWTALVRLSALADMDRIAFGSDNATMQTNSGIADQDRPLGAAPTVTAADANVTREDD